MPIPFELVMGEPPVSQQARRRGRVREWTRRVRSAATGKWRAQPAVTGAVAVTITYLYDGAPVDVDNMAKPILDALSGLVYEDDSQVSDLLCRKRDRNEELLIREPSPDVLESLRVAGPVLHVVVAPATTAEVAL